MNTTRSRLLASSFLCGAALLAAAPAMAQSTEPTTGNGRVVTEQNNGQADASSRVQPDAAGLNAPADNGTTVGEVVVTGSRIARRDYVADSPIVSVGPKAIENTGDITLERTLTQLPQVVNTNGAQVNNGGNGQVNFALRGIGSTRTLVLVDGRRITPSNASGVVDINTIPAALIENIEIITGGASSAYGSDAIAGVANFKLKHNFQGLVIDSQYNIAEAGDGEQQGVNITAGGNFADGRGNATVSFGYANRDAVFYGARPGVQIPGFADFGLPNASILAFGGFSGTIPQGSASALANFGVNAAGNNTTGANSFTQAAVNTVLGRYGVAAGTVAVNASTAFGFNTDGTLFFKGVNYKGPTDTLDFQTIPQTPLNGALGGAAGNGPGAYNTGALNYALLPQTRYNAYASANYKINDHVEAYGQFIYTQYTSATVLAPTPAAGSPATAVGAATTPSTGFLVPATNPLIPADLRTLLASRPNPNAPFLFNKRFTEFGFRNATIQYDTFQFLTGLRGDIPDAGNHELTYDVYATYGRTTRDDVQTGNLNRTAFRQLLESPTGNLGNCTGYNPFGQNGVSQACRNLLSPTTKNLTTFTQRQVEATLNGRAFTLGLMDKFGGDFRFALGSIYRQDRYQFIPDAIAAATETVGTVGSNTNPFNNANALAGFNAAQAIQGVTDVYEVYGELLVPVAHDLPFMQRLDLDLGARFSDYNFSSLGRENQLNTTTYKAELNWKATDYLTLRGGYNRAVRAPNVGELFTPQQTNFAAIGNPGVLGSGDPCDRASAYLTGANAASVRALCIAQGVPAGALSTFSQQSSQAPSTSGGNPNLNVERANTYTGGFVIQPKFSNPLFARMSLSVDYYNISIQGYITNIATSTSLSKCYNADGSNPTYSLNNVFCQAIARDPGTGQLSSSQSTSANVGGLKTSGIDAQFDWGFALSALPMLNLDDKWGSLSFNLVANWLNDLDFKTTPTDRYQQNRGTISSQGYTPVWKAVAAVNYSVGPFDFGVTERYYGDAEDASCIGLTTVCTARGVPATFYTNLTGRWRVNDTLELRAGVDNVTDQDPRFFTSGSSSQAFSDGSTYDFIGRRYFVALKARF